MPRVRPDTVLFRNDPQSRVLPDTNAWLDATFWPQGVARRALNLLSARNVPVIIESMIEGEAERILARLKIELGLSFDPVLLFQEFTARFLHLSPAPLISVNVNKADQPVARAAVHYQATILTQDAPLVAECADDGIAAQFPWDMITSQGEPLEQADIVRVVSPNKEISTIFARVTPGGWLGMTNVGGFTVVEIENIGRLWFDSSSEEWIFDSAVTVRLKFPPASKGMSLVAATYALPASGNGKIVLRAYSPASGESGVVSHQTLKKLKSDAGEMRLGSSLKNEAHWNGYIRHLTISPQSMSAQKWKAICGVPNAAPNPLNEGALRAGLLAVERAIRSGVAVISTIRRT